MGCQTCQTWAKGAKCAPATHHRPGWSTCTPQAYWTSTWTSQLVIHSSSSHRGEDCHKSSCTGLESGRPAGRVMDAHQWLHRAHLDTDSRPLGPHQGLCTAEIASATLVSVVNLHHALVKTTWGNGTSGSVHPWDQTSQQAWMASIPQHMGIR